ncbi:hypothetical protein PTKU64_88340 [Paraburkholderia terrae]|uniref:Uncharacterized protein n=1 Tax=Paraburkholderia terrae TaxID=311230 RepID=A0ABM7U2F6_9BURK|nr:hypothetical protein PTKU64_88340 [Paraburkholderia terrae]
MREKHKTHAHGQHFQVSLPEDLVRGSSKSLDRFMDNWQIRKPGLGQLDAARQALEQRCSKLRFESLHLLANGRLGKAQLGRGMCETEVPGR